MAVRPHGHTALHPLQQVRVGARAYVLPRVRVALVINSPAAALFSTVRWVFFLVSEPPWNTSHPLTPLPPLRTPYSPWGRMIRFFFDLLCRLFFTVYCFARFFLTIVTASAAITMRIAPSRPTAT